ncbi:unnamed protein product [Rhodiola kirilowii]
MEGGGGGSHQNKRGLWTEEEDKILTEYIEVHGKGQWNRIAKKTGLKRCGKSCRLRWVNYLSPNVKKGSFTEDEDDLIIRLHKLLGNRWSLIAGRVPGRTDNQVKNYWNTHLSKRNGSSKRQRTESYPPNPDTTRSSSAACSKDSEATTTLAPLRSNSNTLTTTENAEHEINASIAHQSADAVVVADGQKCGSSSLSWREQLDEQMSSYQSGLVQFSDEFLQFDFAPTCLREELNSWSICTVTSGRRTFTRFTGYTRRRSDSIRTFIQGLAVAIGRCGGSVCEERPCVLLAVQGDVVVLHGVQVNMQLPNQWLWDMVDEIQELRELEEEFISDEEEEEALNYEFESENEEVLEGYGEEEFEM